MTTPDQAAPAGSLADRARQVRFTTVLDVTLTAVFSAIGWVFGALWFAVAYSFMYFASSVAWGFRAGARRPQPDEREAAQAAAANADRDQRR